MEKKYIIWKRKNSKKKTKTERKIKITKEMKK